MVYVPSSTQFLDDLCHELATREWWYRLQKEGAHVKCAKLISKVTGERVTEVVRQDSEYHLRKLIEVNGEDRPVYVRLRDQGLGVYRLALLIMWLAALRPKLVLIDDVELAAHPRLVRHLVRYLVRDLGAQVVVSTHSIDVVSSVAHMYAEGELEAGEAQVIALSRDEGDVLHAERMSVHEVYAVLSAGRDPREIAEALRL